MTRARDERRRNNRAAFVASIVRSAPLDEGGARPGPAGPDSVTPVRDRGSSPLDLGPADAAPFASATGPACQRSQTELNPTP